MKIKDQINRTLHLAKKPERIISLVPSQTELLVDLGLEDRIVGITKFCIHPKHLKKTKSIVGGTKAVKIEKILSLQPDLIICNKEENTQDIIDELSTYAPLYVSDISTIDDMYCFINDCGKLCNVVEKSNTLVKEIRSELASFTKTINSEANFDVAYFIWKKPWMVAASDTFINTMLSLNGMNNVFSTESRYPEITLSDVRLKKATHIFLSTEPFPFKQKDVDALQKQFPDAEVTLVDGELYSWYGSRILKAIQYFKFQLTA